MSAAAKVGIFMLVILGILAFLILRIEDIPIGADSGVQTIDVLFDSVAGLDEKSAVRVAGVRVGKVSDIALRPDGRAVVTLEVSDDIELRDGATARVANLGLLGEKYIELIPGPLDAPVISSAELELDGSTSASVDTVTDQVAAIADDLKAITESIRSTTAGPEGEQRLDEIVENIRQLTGSLRELVDANRVNVTATAANLRAITDDLRVELPKIAATVERAASAIEGTVTENREDVRSLVTSLRDLSDDLKTTSENLGAVTTQVRSGEGTVGKLLYSDEAHERLTGALGSVESGVNELRETLGRINQVELRLGIEGEYYAGIDDRVDDELGGNSRTAVTADLWPDPEKNRFYHLALASTPFGDKDVKVIEETTRLEDGTEEVIVVREEKYERDYLISAQAGWEFDELSVRLGLFENTGGIGADYDWNERLRITAEAFDFGGYRNDDPRLRLFGRYLLSSEKETMPQIFLTAGVDNPLNDTAFIFGGGIRWTDEELKYLLGSIPTP